jgi:PhzF family phenazine biosynthesis protein
MQLHELKCFGEHPGDGNPACVIEDNHASQAERAIFARERNMTCVFLDVSETMSGAISLDYFYPHTRSPLCLHATLAAAYVLMMRTQTSAPLAVSTAWHGQSLILSREGEDFFVQVQRQKPPTDLPATELTIELLRRLLAAPALSLQSPPVVASVGSPKLLIEVADRDCLYHLQPDLARVTAWGREHGVNGCYVYCRLPDGRFEGRNFNHLDPAQEDSATGVAAGALSVTLGQGLNLRQGQATGRPCLIRTIVEGDAVRIGGRVER